jgi:molybdopterin synthase catalytic subunit
MFLTHEPIDLAALIGVPLPSDGAVCVFLGVVRNESDGKETVAIEYQAYDEMAKSEIAHIVSSLAYEYPRASLRICHRLGRLSVGEPSVAIVATAPHREEAFTICRRAIEWLKEWVPIWKREIRPDGTGEWVEPKRPDRITRSEVEDFR